MQEVTINGITKTMTDEEAMYFNEAVEAAKAAFAAAEENSIETHLADIDEALAELAGIIGG